VMDKTPKSRIDLIKELMHDVSQRSILMARHELFTHNEVSLVEVFGLEEYNKGMRRLVCQIGQLTRSIKEIEDKLEGV